MKTRALLLQSASAAAAVAVGTNHAAAADIEGYAGPDYSGYTLSLEGGALFADSVDIDKLGSGGPISGGPGLDLNLDNDIGYYAGIRLGRRINQNWDVTLGAAVSRFLKNGTDDSYFFSGGVVGPATAQVQGSLKSDLDFTTLDFEVGYRPDSLAEHDVRLFLGLRGLNSKDSLDKTGLLEISGSGGSGGSFSFADNADSEFLGIGPRAGASFAHRFDDSSLGLSGMVAGAAIFGRRESDKTGEFSIFSSGGSGGSIVFSGTDSDNEKVYNLEGALGLDFYLGESSKLTVGARAQKWWNIRGADLGSGGSDDDHLNVGPFMLLEADF
jgi:hypothetical protein